MSDGPLNDHTEEMKLAARVVKFMVEEALRLKVPISKHQIIEVYRLIREGADTDET